MTFALGNVIIGERLVPAIRVDHKVYLVSDLAGATGPLPDSTIGMLQDWASVFPKLCEAMSSIQSGVVDAVSRPERELQLGKPVAPTKVFCVGANYADHLKEMGDDPERPEGRPPFFYMKPASTAICGPGNTVEIPSGCQDFDWEGEVVVVFGKSGKNISAKDALSHVAGYTMGIDFTSRDQFRVPEILFQFHFSLGKCQDNTAPIGPWIVPKQFVDGNDLGFNLSVNGVRKQESRTSAMLWSLAEQIEEISSRIAIEAGDILFTGTPAGVGAPRGEKLHPKDQVIASGEMIGDLTVTIRN